MNRTRVIPVLLLRRKGLVKTVRFRDPTYVGDPINSVRIFNEKEVDELAFLDISATPERREPDYDLLADIAGEAFMPMAYGGGITTVEQLRRIFSLGFEKVVLNTVAHTNPAVVHEAVSIYGAQSIVGCVDVRRSFLGRYELSSGSGRVKRKAALGEHLSALMAMGVGELLVNSVDRDGTRTGYDLALLKEVTSAVSVPVIACGGARGIEDFVAAVEKGGASAVAAGSIFVFHGPHRAVLISYPERRVLAERLP